MKSAAQHLLLVLICCFLPAQRCLCDHRPATVCINNSDVLVVNGHFEMINGFQFRSDGDHLIPVSGNPPDPAPFTFFLSNTPFEVVWGAVPAVRLDGDWVTQVGYDGFDLSAADLSASWGIFGGRPIPIPLNSGTFGTCSTTPIEDFNTADFNHDNVIDLLDIDLLGLEISEGTNDASFNLNGDQLVNQDDLNLFLGGNFITRGNKLNGDADFNGTVAFADFLILSSNFGQDGKRWSEGDFIANGRVEFADFLTLSSNFGQCDGCLRW